MSESPYRIIVLDGVAETCAKSLKDDGYQVEQMKAIEGDPASALAEYDAAAIRGATKINADVLETASARLKLVVRVGAGVDNIDLQAATRFGVVVENTPGTNARAVIELTIGALLAMARNTIPAQIALKGGEWAKKKYSGSELRGKTIGIIGLGKIGQGVAQICKALGMKVTGFDPVMTETRAGELGIELASLEEMYGRSDYVSLHASLNDKTKGMINTDALSAMKDGVGIVNCARAGLVEKDAMLAALDSGKVRTYFTDVFDSEPPEKDDPLVVHPSVMVTPHLGGSTEESSIEGARQAAEQIKAFLSSGSAINAVNYESGDPELVQWEVLSCRLGTFMFRYLEGQGGFSKVNLTYHGSLAERQTNGITSAFFKGFMGCVNHQANMVNAQHLAHDSGIEIVESRTEGGSDRIEIEIETSKAVSSVTASCVADKQVLQTLDGALFDITLEDNHFLVTHHSDVPGMVGIIGTVLGKHSVNIQKMGLRDRPGQPAMALITAREELSEAVVNEIQQDVEAKGGEITLHRISI